VRWIAQLSRLFRAPDTRAKNRAGKRLWSCSTINWFARHPNFDPMAAAIPVFDEIGNGIASSETCRITVIKSSRKRG
jgi:hypothetical protein